MCVNVPSDNILHVFIAEVDTCLSTNRSSRHSTSCIIYSKMVCSMGLVYHCLLASASTSIGSVPATCDMPSMSL